jgi:hypothetical protein
MNDASTPSEECLQLIEELIDEHIRVDCTLIPIDDSTWALHGTVVVDDNVIVAEFDTKDDAEDALARINAAQAVVDGRMP